jgi:hypothetical protein
MELSSCCREQDVANFDREKLHVPDDKQRHVLRGHVLLHQVRGLVSRSWLRNLETRHLINNGGIKYEMSRRTRDETNS